MSSDMSTLSILESHALFTCLKTEQQNLFKNCDQKKNKNQLQLICLQSLQLTSSDLMGNQNDH